MKAFDIVLDSFEKCKRQELSHEVFYPFFCEKIAILNAEERIKMLKISEEFAGQDEKLLAHHFLCRGMAATFSAQFVEGINSSQESFRRFLKMEHAAGCMASNNMTAVNYRSLGQLDKAQQYMQVAVAYLNKIEGESNYHVFQSITCYQAAELCQQFKKYEEAEKFYLRGLGYIKDNSELKGRLESSLGINFMLSGNKKSAAEYFDKALISIKGGQNILLESKVYSDKGLFHLRNGELQEALKNQLIALEIREKNKMLNPACTSYILLAENYFEMGELGKAMEFAEKGIERATQLNTLIKLFEAHLIISRIHEKKGSYKEAFEHYKLFNKYKDEVHNQEVVRKIEQLNTQHKIDSSEKEKEIFRLRNVELRSALDEIHDSFTYARRIQNSLLASEWYIGTSMKRLMKN